MKTTIEHPEIFDQVLFPDTPGFSLAEHLILLTRRGSEAHGTYRQPTEPDAIDDRDLLGVVMPPMRYRLGLQQWEHAEAIRPPWDVVLYDVSKFVRLLTKQNPNVLSILWANDEDQLLVTEQGRMLLEARALFRAKEQAFQSFVGYANGQLRRMTHTKFMGYQGAKRRQLVEKHGWDCKNGAHLIRLLRMGIEYLMTGRLLVRRPDAAELVAIKKGEWSLQRVLEESEILFRRAHEAKERSTLPEKIDFDAVDDLLRRLYGMTPKTWSGRGTP